MLPFDPSSLPLAGALAIFAGAAGVVWVAGTRLSGYAEALSERTGIGAAFMGALFLGGITSLPEIATTLSASITGNADLAVNNLFGGIAMQVAVLAVADATLRKGSLSSTAREPVILLQGVLLMLVLTIAIAGMVLGEPVEWPIGPWAAAVLGTVLISFYLMRRYEGHAAWLPVTEEGGLEEVERKDAITGREDGTAEPVDSSGDRRHSLIKLVGLSTLSALEILIAGVLLVRTGEVVASRTGLGSSFVGATLLAAATSLPEVSTTVAAARLGRFDMAFSNVFGANLFDAGLIGVTDLAHQGSPILGLMGDFAISGALLAIAVTAVFLVGVIRRRVRSIAQVGIDSLLVLVIYLAGMYGLFTLR